MHKMITLLALLLLTSTAAADGLFYQLPEDGAWALYDMNVTMTREGQTRDATGELRMASVGKSVEDEVSCRWIELRLSMKMDNNERTIVSKILTPESELKEGGDPIGKRVRGWIRMGVGASERELTNDNLGPMPVFLAKKMSDQKELPAEEIESKLGKQPCKGVTGTLEWTERGAANEATVTVRRHPKAPFGVVNGDVKITVTRENRGAESLEMNVSLKDFGLDAKSELPDQK